MFFRDVSSPHALSSVLLASLLLDLAVCGKFLFISKTIRALNLQLIEFLLHWSWTDGVVVFFSEVDENIGEVDVFFLHFLVMTSALLCLPTADK